MNDTLKKRAIVGIIGGGSILTIIAIPWNGPFFIFTVTLIFLCLSEASSLFLVFAPRLKKYVFFLSALFPLLAFSFFGLKDSSLFQALHHRLLFQLLLLIFGLWLVFKGEAKDASRSTGILFISLAWIFSPLDIILLLKKFHQTPLLFFLFLSTWMLDSFSYGFGLKFGKRQLAPTISPKKTWEGALGGLGGAVLSGIFFSFLFPQQKTFFLIAGCLLGISSQIGDLFESWLKRKRAVKDSGTLLPGHGGALDRFDGFLFNAALIAFLKLFL